MLRFTLSFSHHTLNLAENSQCSGSWSMFHSSSIGFPSIRSNYLRQRDSPNHLVLLSHALTGSRLTSPRQSTESEKTWFLRLQTEQPCQSAGSSLSPPEPLPMNRSNTSIFSFVIDQLSSHLKQLSQLFLGLIPGRTQIIRKVCPKMNCSLKSDGHEYTPYSCVHLR